MCLRRNGALETLGVSMEELENGNIASHKRHCEAWKKKNFITRIALLSSIDDDIMREFKSLTIFRTCGTHW